MARLSKIVVQNFRNIELQELSFSPNMNCISGNNGEGKTNLLDAIHYLSMTKSAFGSPDRYNFRHGTSAFALSGVYSMPTGVQARFSLQVEDGAEKKLKMDDSACRISDHLGRLPVVMVSPSDISLVSESGDERRRFSSSVLSQMDRTFLQNLQKYTRLLSQRNAALKAENVDFDLLAAVDAMLGEYGDRIHERRARFIAELEPIVQEYYEKISGGSEHVGIEYKSDLDKAPLHELLLASRQKDSILRYTSVGVQRDDFIFTLDGHPIRRCGSQGQQKSFLVALKFAQYEVMKRSCGSAPILLLDDLFDKLDMGRVSNLLQMVAGEDFGQIFLTDSNKVRMKSIVDAITADRAYFEAEGGAFRLIHE